MKIAVALCVAAACVLLATPAVRAQSNQIIPGTQVRLTLLNSLSSRVARDGDPFTAVVAEPVFSGSTQILPAGAAVHGRVTGITRPKFFSMFRGGASMNLLFDSIEVESRIFPARMSILSIYSASTDGKRRKDLKTVEGEMVQENQDVKSDIVDVGMGTAAGSTAGLVFTRLLRGTVFGLVGSGAYIAAKKGKDVELPARTGFLVRMNSTVSLPASLLHNVAYMPAQ